MKDVIIFLSIIIFSISVVIFSIYSEIVKIKAYKSITKDNDEYIKQLEQSLNEQIQEVEVYKGMLEEK